MVASPAPKNSETWFFDTGATHHLARDIKTLSDVQAYKGNEQVIVGNGKKLPILHTGSKFFSSTSINFHLKKVYHVSHLTTNLISVSKFCTDNNVFSQFHPKFFLVRDQVSRQVLFQGQLKNGLYEFPPLIDDALAVFYTPTTSNITSSLWHSRLGHPTVDILTKALDSCNIVYQRNKRDACSACPIAKSHKLPFSLSNSRASHPLALIHTDLWGPAPIPSTTGARYFLLFIDDFSRFSWIYSLHTKDQALSTFIKFKTMVENQFAFHIQCLL